MKQVQWLCAAALISVSTAALAQSSVTIYGTVDAAFGHSYNRGNMQSNTFLNTSDTFIGFRGVEDLGAGNQAGFKFKQRIYLNNGATTDRIFPDDPIATAWELAANVWMGGTWGRLTLGQDDTPSYETMKVWDLPEDSTFSVVTEWFGTMGSRISTAQPSQFKYTSPTYNGLTAIVGYTFKSDNANVFKSDIFDHSRYDIGLTYENGPLSLGALFNRFESFGSNYAVGGKYKFGHYAVSAGYYKLGDARLTDDNGRILTENLFRKGFSLGVQANFGPYMVFLTAARPTKIGANIDGKYVDYKKYAYTTVSLQGRYNFTKRTFVYMTYFRRANHSSYAVGVRHDF